jgi:Glyoxalase superfamily protein
MRDFRDAKVMARALRDALKAQAIETTHTEALELIAKAFGCKSWNVLSAKIEAAEPKPIDERELSASSATVAPKRRTATGDRHGERAGPSEITRDYIAHPAWLAVKDIGYQQRGFNWEKASIRVYLHGQSVDIAQGVVSTGNKCAGDQGIAFGYTAGRPVAPRPAVWHANPKKFVIGELRRGQIETRWRPLRHVPIIGFGKIIPDT